MLKKILGILMILTGTALGLYVGVWFCFIGGIVGLIDQFKADNIEHLVIAINIAKIVFAGFFGWLCCAVLALPGMTILNSNN